MGNIKRKHNIEFKTKVALELIRGKDTINTICSHYCIHPTQAHSWKNQAIESMQAGFNGADNSIVKELKETKELNDELYRQIGQSKVELDWLKKKVESI